VPETTVTNDSDACLSVELESEIIGPSSKRIPTKRTGLIIWPWESKKHLHDFRIHNPRLWSCDDPQLYRLRTKIYFNGNQIDTYDTPFGIRDFKWDAKKGFFLNGKPLKIKGMCNHRDHAGVGAALPDRLHELRIEKLKALGCNAFRASHYPHATELLDACDRFGILVMAENRLAGSSPEVLSQLESMIRRDRNHPSIILWSLANEEHTIQWKIAGERIGKTMVRLCHKLDPTRKVTAAMHDKGLGVGFANIVDVHGWNYMKVGDIEAYHRRHPNRPIVGSEEASTVCTRGIYADDPKRGYVRAYDERAPGWGSTAESWWKFFAARDWLAGAFVWTGFDYRGEPIPYKWPCTASHFGVMDLCGFPKDNYYYYKSWWSDETVLHLFPHWNWQGREGEAIDVRCFTNCDEVELFLNHRSRGRKSVERNSHVAWKVRFEPGTLEAIGYRAGKQITRAKVETTSAPARIVLIPDRESIRADGEDVSSVTVSVVDAQGRTVPAAGNLIRFEVSGTGRLLGVGNGDPSSHESDKVPQRRLFNGLALGLIQSARTPGEIYLRARSPGLLPARITLRAKKATLRPEVP
jgi:beta-galactosidase